MQKREIHLTDEHWRRMTDLEENCFIQAGPPPSHLAELDREVVDAAETYVELMFTPKNGEAIKALKAALKAAGRKHEPR